MAVVKKKADAKFGRRVCFGGNKASRLSAQLFIFFNRLKGAASRTFRPMERLPHSCARLPWNPGFEARAVANPKFG